MINNRGGLYEGKVRNIVSQCITRICERQEYKNISTMRKSELIDAIIAAAEREEKKEPAEVEDVVFEDAGAEHDVAGISDESHHKRSSMLKKIRKIIIMHSQDKSMMLHWQMEYLRFYRTVMDL